MGIINGVVNKIRQGQRRDLEIMEEMYHEQKMKRDYYRTAQCPHSRGGTPASCATCTLAPVCKTGTRCR